jgi:hypothetical protein
MLTRHRAGRVGRVLVIVAAVYVRETKVAEMALVRMVLAGMGAEHFLIEDLTALGAHLSHGPRSILTRGPSAASSLRNGVRPSEELTGRLGAGQANSIQGAGGTMRGRMLLRGQGRGLVTAVF